MKKTIITVLMMVCFAATFALETVKYEVPKRADYKSEGNWYQDIEVGEFCTMITGNIMYHVDSSFVEKIIYSQYLIGPEHNVKENGILGAEKIYNLPVLTLKFKTKDSFYIRYEIIKRNKIVTKSEEYLIDASDISKYGHYYSLNKIDKIEVLLGPFYNSDVFKTFIKPFADALYLGHTIKLYIRDSSGNSESVYITGTGFGKAVKEFLKYK
jgi:hypothetical protein